MKFQVTIPSCLSLVIFCSIGLIGQTVDYQRQRQMLNQHIELLSQNLSNTNKELGELASDYNLIKKTIEKREELKNLIKEEIAEIDSISQSAQQDIISLSHKRSKRLDQLKLLVRKERYQQLTFNIWSGLLSLEGLKSHFLTWRYNQQIKDYIQNNIEEIGKLSIMASDTIVYLENIRTEKVELLKEGQENEEILKRRYKESQSLFKSVQQEERRIRSILAKQQEEALKMNRLISGAIQGNSSTLSNYNATNFLNQKGRLPWPVDNGVITKKFGIQMHETVNGVKTNNHGIDMLCLARTEVKTIDRGQVLLVAEQPPYNKVVIIKHGEYTSAYYHLGDVLVNKGDQLNAFQTIGRLSSLDRSANFHFEIWHNQKQVNPEHWLKNR